jgi:hypothetical protein
MRSDLVAFVGEFGDFESGEDDELLRVVFHCHVACCVSQREYAEEMFATFPLCCNK